MSAAAVLLATSMYVPVPAVVAFLIVAGLLFSRRDRDARVLRHAVPALVLVSAALALLAFAGSAARRAQELRRDQRPRHRSPRPRSDDDGPRDGPAVAVLARFA
jgi:hypothetical protein